MTEPLRVLLLEDDPNDAELARLMLTAAPLAGGVELHHVATIAELGAWVAGGGMADVALVDIHIPDGRGPGVVTEVIDRIPSVGVVVLTGVDDDLTRPCLEAGAHAYLPKAEQTTRTLVRTIESAQAIHGIRCELEEALERQSALTAELEDLLGIVAHDLRAPLRTARLFADRVVNDREHSRTWLRRLDASLERMDEMIHAVLTYARLARRVPEPEVVDLGAVLTALADDLAADLMVSGGTLSWDADVTLWCSAANLRQIVQNLVTNSLQYCSAERQPTVVVEAREDGDHVVVLVHDNGFGMEEQYQAQAFRPFERLTTEGDGLGIGLATSARLAQMNGGQLRIERSVPGTGTTMRLELPGAAARLTEGPPRSVEIDLGALESGSAG